MPTKIPTWVKTVSEVLLQASQGPSIDISAPRRLADQLGQWIGHLSKNATMHWAATAISGQPCSFCDQDAVSKCIACSGLCCLGHSHISHRAELVCDECIGKLLDNKTSSKKSAVDQAFEFFNLTSSASLEEVTAVYRIRMRSAHPDVGGTDRESQQINRHYDVLKSYYSGKRAA